MDGVEEKKLLHLLKRISYLVKRISLLVMTCFFVFLSGILHSSELETKPSCPLNKNVLERDTFHASRDTLYVFVSFSLNDTVLKQYAREAKKAGAPLVLRGLVNNSMKATLSRLQPIVQETQANFLIDPMAFRKFGIEKVPAVVVVSSLHEPRTTSTEPRFDVVYGLTTLDYALEKIAHEGEAAPTAQEALKRLRGSS